MARFPVLLGSAGLDPMLMESRGYDLLISQQWNQRAAWHMFGP